MMGGCFFFIFGCCAGTETAITTLWPWKVRELAQREAEKAEGRGGSRWGMWSALRGDIQRFMQTILIGATLSGVFGTAFATEICAQLFGGQGLVIATVSVSVLELICCEIVPKSIAVCYAYEFARITLPFYYAISKVVYPVGRQLNRLVESCLMVLGISIDASKTPYVSEDELDLMLQSAMQTGILETEEGKMISSVRELDTTRANDIMVPLVDMICINTTKSISDLQEAFSRTQYNRLPVYKDRFDNVVGIVSMKTLLRKVRNFQNTDWNTVTVGEIIDRPFFVPETMTVLNLLQLLKERSIAVCVDEYGGTTGLVTLEDALEEIVGEIYDPDVESLKIPGKRKSNPVESLGDGRYLMKASTDLDDVSEALGVELPEGLYNSVGGFLVDTADRVLRPRDTVRVRSRRMTVVFEAVEVDERKVIMVEAQVLPHEEEEEDEESGSDDPDGEDMGLARVLDVALEEREEASDDADANLAPSLKRAGDADADMAQSLESAGVPVQLEPQVPLPRPVPVQDEPWLQRDVVLGGLCGGVLGTSLGNILGGTDSQVAAGGTAGGILGLVVGDAMSVLSF